MTSETEAQTTYPSTVLVDELRRYGFLVRQLWRLPGPKDTRLAWVVGYSVGPRVIIVQTYTDGGWEVFTDVPDATVEGTIGTVVQMMR